MQERLSGQFFSKERFDKCDVLPIQIATSNPYKYSWAMIERPQEVSISKITPKFDEEKIKEELNISATDGIKYAAEVSRKKLDQTRELCLLENPENDAIIATTDSVLALNINGKILAINRDGNEMDDDEVIEHINAEKRLNFIGAVSFGRLQGRSIHTIQTYVSLPLNEKIYSRSQQDISNNTNILDKNTDIEMGYIRHVFNGVDEFDQVIEIVKKTKSFDEAKSYITGMPKEVLGFISKTMNFESKNGAEIKTLIEKYPFNSLAFRHLHLNNPNLSLNSLYQKIVDNSEDFLEIYGGNCSLLTLKLAKIFKENGLDFKIATFESKKPKDKEGHSGIVLEENGSKYLFDPGLTIPFPIPINSEIPLFPHKIDKKTISVEIDSQTNNPNIVVFTSLSRRHRLPGISLLDYDDFLQRLPDTLVRLHKSIDCLVIDYHSQEGIKKFGIGHDLNNDTIYLKSFGKSDLIIKREEFAQNSHFQMQLMEQCISHGIDHKIIFSQILSLINPQ